MALSPPQRTERILARADAELAAAPRLGPLLAYLRGSLPEAERVFLDGAVRDAFLCGYLSRAHEERDLERAVTEAAGVGVAGEPSPTPRGGLPCGWKPPRPQNRPWWRRLWPW